MPKLIHGHEVMKMMVASGKTFSRETLRADIENQFGTDARFHTCSTDNMTADELITFLEKKGKFHGGDASFTTDPSKICDH